MVVLAGMAHGLNAAAVNKGYMVFLLPVSDAFIMTQGHIGPFSTFLSMKLTGISCAKSLQSNTFQSMGFHYRFSRGDRVQIISGKHKEATGTVDANVFQRSVDFPKDHLPCHHVLLHNHLVITINVNQVEPLESL